MFVDDIYLSPNHKIEDGIQLFNNLSPDSDKEDWKKAIDIFIDRIQGRYLDIIHKLESVCSQDESVKNGFSIMALNCLLIETLEQFYRGWKDSKNRSKESFISFLTQSPYFNGTSKISLKEFGQSFDANYAEIFYTEVRCGILHQAETKGNVMLTYYGQSLVDDTTNNDWILFDVGRFTKALDKEFKRYIDRLRDDKQRDVRECFCRKWRYIIARAEAIKNTTSYQVAK
ncbi:hypothetical protein [Halobacillus kuroshimensis]|uniref:hypothetical protein n=1 Tax=Halobacillus kuroshimensis TaxID=302481 RepID=UPI000405FFE3|nr:hypothetical protein [Halobacillus kuroshimensis]